MHKFIDTNYVFVYIYIYQKKVNAHHAGQKLEIYVAKKWELQQHSRANEQKNIKDISQ